MIFKGVVVNPQILEEKTDTFSMCGSFWGPTFWQLGGQDPCLAVTRGCPCVQYGCVCAHAHICACVSADVNCVVSNLAGHACLLACMHACVQNLCEFVCFGRVSPISNTHAPPRFHTFINVCEQSSALN